MKTGPKFPHLRRAVLLVVAVACLIFFGACDQSGAQLVISSDTYSISAGDAVDIDELREKYLADTTEASDENESGDTATSSETADIPIMIAPDTTSDIDDTESQAYTVYWVKNGEVWHTRKTCSTLSRSKSILSGTVEQAMLAGKDRVCKRCG